MPLSLYIEITYERPDGVTARKWSDFSKKGNTEVSEAWHEKYLPSHFAENAASKYDYRKRAPSTLKKKARLAKRGLALHGGRRALVESGLLQEQATRRGIVRVYPTRFTITMPTHVPRRPRNSSIDLHAEVTAVTSEQSRALAKIWKNSILVQLAGYRPRRRVQIR